MTRSRSRAAWALPSSPGPVRQRNPIRSRTSPRSKRVSTSSTPRTSVAEGRGVSRAQIALAWLRHNPVVAPLVGASKTSHIDDAVASLEIELTGDEVAQLERPYTPRYDFQGISDDAELARISARIGIKPAGT